MANTQIEKRFLKEEEKLMNALEDTDLIWELDTKEPITLTIKPDITAAEQTSILPEDKDKTSSMAKLQLIFEDGYLIIKTDKKLIIEDSLLSKIKNIAKKLHYYYLWLVYTEDEKKAQRNKQLKIRKRKDNKNEKRKSRKENDKTFKEDKQDL